MTEPGKDKGRPENEEAEEPDEIEQSPETISFTVPAEAEGTRLDTFLASQTTVTSRSQIRRAIELGKVTVKDQQITKPAYEVRAGEEIQLNNLRSSQKSKRASPPVGLALSILDIAPGLCFAQTYRA